MDKVAILTDSTADIPSQIAEALGITVIPVTILFGQEGFRDRIDMTPEEFYRRLAESGVHPTTSQPSAGDFVEVYRQLSQSAQSIISIHVSSDLSGTVESAHAAKAQLDSSVPIHIVDSRSTSMGLGFMVLAAAEMVADGVEAAQIVARIEALVPQMSVLFVVDTLEYLHKGGRIGGAERYLGSMLRIKPLLHLDNGRIEPLEKARTKPRAMARLLEIVEERISDGRPRSFAVMHATAEEEALQLKQELEERFPGQEPYLCKLSPALGVHTGPGLVGVAFYTEE